MKLNAKCKFEAYHIIDGIEQDQHISGEKVFEIELDGPKLTQFEKADTDQGKKMAVQSFLHSPKGESVLRDAKLVKTGRVHRRTLQVLEVEIPKKETAKKETAKKDK